jgi:anti-anti-sigma factor
LPAEVDIANCDDVYMELCSAVAPGITVVIADMTKTTLCDGSGIREITQASKYAGAAGVQLRFVIPPGNVLRVLELVGLDEIWMPYPTLEAALESELGRDSQARSATQSEMADKVSESQGNYLA